MIYMEALEEFLIKEWSTGLRLTTVPQAMQRLGIADDAGLRWRVAKRLEALWHQVLTSPEKREQIAAALGRPLDEVREERWRQQVSTWGLASVLLSEEEKLAARHILMRQREGSPLPQPVETSKTLGLPVSEVHKAIRTLARLGFLSLSDGRRPARYALADNHERFLEGLGFSFHTVSLDTGERFGVR